MQAEFKCMGMSGFHGKHVVLFFVSKTRLLTLELHVGLQGSSPGPGQFSPILQAHLPTRALLSHLEFISTVVMIRL